MLNDVGGVGGVGVGSSGGDVSAPPPTISSSNSRVLNINTCARWSKSMPAVLNALASLLSNVGATAAGSMRPPASAPRAQLPRVVWGDANPGDCLLQPEWLWLLSQGVCA